MQYSHGYNNTFSFYDPQNSGVFPNFIFSNCSCQREVQPCWVFLITPSTITVLRQLSVVRLWQRCFKNTNSNTTEHDQLCYISAEGFQYGRVWFALSSTIDELQQPDLVFLVPKQTLEQRRLSDKEWHDVRTSILWQYDPIYIIYLYAPNLKSQAKRKSDLESSYPECCM